MLLLSRVLVKSRFLGPRVDAVVVVVGGAQLLSMSILLVAVFRQEVQRGHRGGLGHQEHGHQKKGKQNLVLHCCYCWGLFLLLLLLLLSKCLYFQNIWWKNLNGVFLFWLLRQTICNWCFAKRQILLNTSFSLTLTYGLRLRGNPIINVCCHMHFHSTCVYCMLFRFQRNYFCRLKPI